MAQGRCSYKTDDKGAKPEIYILKTYLVESVEGNVVNIVRDGFKHKPFVGDKLGVAPEEIGGAMSTYSTVDSVVAKKVGNQDVWACTMGRAIEASKGDILVEAEEEGGLMLVKQINAVADADMDMLDAPAEEDEDFEGARYSYTPALGGIMYEYKMSPLPECVKKLNQSKVNGWFQIQSV